MLPNWFTVGETLCLVPRLFCFRERGRVFFFTQLQFSIFLFDHIFFILNWLSVKKLGKKTEKVPAYIDTL